MGSSLPRHGAKIKTKTQSRIKKIKGRLQVSIKKKWNKNLYDAWIVKCHDACSNAVKLSSNSQNWLEHRVSNKNPKNFREPLVQFEKIDQVIITHNRIQFIMIKYINPTSQFYQVGPNWTKSPIRIHTSPWNFNFSKFTKLIKLNHQDQVHNIQEQKPHWSILEKLAWIIKNLNFA